MRMRKPYTLVVKVPRDHVGMLDVIAEHDLVSRSSLVRDAIKRLIHGRKLVLYPHNYAVQENDNDIQPK